MAKLLILTLLLVRAEYSKPHFGIICEKQEEAITLAQDILSTTPTKQEYECLSLGGLVPLTGSFRIVSKVMEKNGIKLWVAELPIHFAGKLGMVYVVVIQVLEGTDT